MGTWVRHRGRATVKGEERVADRRLGDKRWRDKEGWLVTGCIISFFCISIFLVTGCINISFFCISIFYFLRKRVISGSRQGRDAR